MFRVFNRYDRWNYIYILDEQIKQISLLTILIFERVLFPFPSLLTNRFYDRWSARSFNHECNSNPSHRSTERTTRVCCTLDPDSTTSESVVHYGNAWFFIRSSIDVFSFFFFFLIKRAARSNTSKTKMDYSQAFHEICA